MKRSLSLFIFLSLLGLSIALGELVWENLAVPGCLERQTELGKRVESYATMHLPEKPPVVQVQGPCGHAWFADALYFRWQNLSWRLGVRKQKPLQDADLRLLSTHDLMQHPDMGPLKFTVRFDPSLDAESRQQLEELVSRYLAVEEPRQRLEFRKIKRSDSPKIQSAAKELPAPPKSVTERSPVESTWAAGTVRSGLLLEPMEPQLKPALHRLKKLLLGFALLVTSVWFVSFCGKIIRQRQLKHSSEAGRATPEDSGSWPILFAPRAARDFGERGTELWQLLQHLDPKRAQARALHWWEKDREGLLQFLVLLDAKVQESILACLSLDQVMQLSETLSQTSNHDRAAHRAALRPLLDLARDLAQCTPMPDSPLFIQLMTHKEWQRVAQQMTRPRRRALAELLDKERASWLRARQDLHPAWFQSGSKEPIAAEQLLRRVRSILQVDADQLREQLYVDREAIAVVDSYFAELTLDSGLNSDLAMLVLGQCYGGHAGFGRLVERRDENLHAALMACDNQQIALLLYELDPHIKDSLFAQLGSRKDPVEAALLVLERDKNHSKSLRMQARSLQRFVERQVLVAGLLCAHE